MRTKISSAKWRPFCLGLNVLALTLLQLIVDIHFYVVTAYCLGVIYTGFLPIRIHESLVDYSERL